MKYIENKLEGGFDKCMINETDKILFGDGGSTSIIIITKNKKVYKIMTLYFYIDDILLDIHIKKLNKIIKNEINIYKLLTKNIIDKNISNNIVKYINLNNCNNAKELFNCPKKYNEYLKLNEDKKTKLCDMLYIDYPIKKLNDKYKVLEIEYCNYSCKDFIKDISNLSIIEMEKYLDIFIFQIIYTIMSIQKIYPFFIHRDLFIRNILGLKEKDNGNYYTYTINNKKYFIPQKLFYPKINDFGMTNLNDKYKSVKLYKNEYKDIYNLLIDIYNGPNLSSNSLTELCKNNEDKLLFLKSYFSNFFNINIIDEYKLKSKNEINWNRNNILDDEYLKSIEMKNPNDLLNDYFYNIFNKINTKI